MSKTACDIYPVWVEDKRKHGIARPFLIWLSNRFNPLDWQDYPQTWNLLKSWIPYWIPFRRKFFRHLYNPSLYWLCGKLVHHELSKTEKGYGGGPYEDRHCRWCDKVFWVPLGDFAREHVGELMGRDEPWQTQ